MPHGTEIPGTSPQERAVRKVVYQQSKHHATGLSIIPEEPYSTLDLQFDLPGRMLAAHGLSDTAMVGRQNVTWDEVRDRLAKGQVRYLTSDAARIRKIDQATNKITSQRAAEALGIQKDFNIMDKLKGAAPSANVVDAQGGGGLPWDDPGGEPEQNIVDAWNALVSGSNVKLSMEGQKGLRTKDTIAMVVPAAAWGTLNSLQLINNVQQTMMGYLAGSFQLEFHPTRTPAGDSFRGTWPLVDQALMAVKGEMTAIHAVYDGSAPDVPLTERQRIMGVGWEYMITQYFETVIIPDGDNGTGKNGRVARIDNIL